MRSACIVIPVIEPSPGLVDLLEWLAGSQLAAHGIREVLVVDNTAERSPRIGRVVREVRDGGSDARFRSIHEPQPHSYAARNRGILATDSTYVAFLDSDVIPRASWLPAIGQIVQDGTTERATGPIIQIAAEPPPRLIDRSAQLLDVLTGLPQERYARQGWAATANLIVRRDIFAAVGQFSPTLESGGDFEFGRRAQRRGISLDFDPDLAVEHLARDSFRGLAAKARRIVRGHEQLLNVLGEREYRLEFALTRRRWWPLWQWLRIGAAVVAKRGGTDVRLLYRLQAASLAPFIGIAALRELKRLA